VALIHRAELHPTKLELLAAWLPGRPWYREQSADIARLASCRFDDPAGAVGVETILVTAGGSPAYHAPLTYRDSPLEGGDAWLIGTAEHSVLGRRWVYDACGDPVYVSTLANAIFTGAGEAEEFLEVDGELNRRETDLTVAGSGRDPSPPAVGAIRRVVAADPTMVVTDSTQLAIIRRVGSAGGLPGAALTGRWPGQETPLPLAYATPLSPQ
jgi:hypothetical protein